MGTYRFVCDGQNLGYWLRELVCDAIDRRDRAANVLMHMYSALPETLDELKCLDVAAHQAEFSTAVCRTLDEPAFAARAYLEELIDFMAAAQELRMHLWD